MPRASHATRTDVTPSRRGARARRERPRPRLARDLDETAAELVRREERQVDRAREPQRSRPVARLQAVRALERAVERPAFVEPEARALEYEPSPATRMVHLEDVARSPGLANRAGERRLPHALREPHPRGLRAEEGLASSGVQGRLGTSISLREHGEHRLLLGPAEELDLPARDELLELLEDVGGARLEPVEQRHPRRGAR